MHAMKNLALTAVVIGGLTMAGCGSSTPTSTGPDGHLTRSPPTYGGKFTGEFFGEGHPHRSTAHGKQ